MYPKYWPSRKSQCLFVQQYLNANCVVKYNRFFNLQTECNECINSKLVKAERETHTFTKFMLRRKNNREIVKINDSKKLGSK